MWPQCMPPLRRCRARRRHSLVMRQPRLRRETQLKRRLPRDASVKMLRLCGRCLRRRLLLRRAVCRWRLRRLRRASFPKASRCLSLRRARRRRRRCARAVAARSTRTMTRRTMTWHWMRTRAAWTTEQTWKPGVVRAGGVAGAAHRHRRLRSAAAWASACRAPLRRRPRGREARTRCFGPHRA